MDSTASWTFIAALTFASSIDNLGVGLSYGIRNIRISFFANLWITMICFLFSMSGIYCGIWISEILSETLPVILGAGLLIIIGLRIMLLAAPRREKVQETLSVSLKKANKQQSNSIKKVINDPTSADFDNSKNINFFEATLLGAALSANALTNGVGAGLLGFSPVLISSLAAAGSFFTVWTGCHYGVKLSYIRVGKYTIGEFGTFISGAVLLLIAATIF